MQRAAEQLEVVRDDEEAAGGDEREQPERPGDRDARRRSRPRPRSRRRRAPTSVRAGDPRLQRPAAAARRARARRRPSRARTASVVQPSSGQSHVRRERRADRDVREVPERVRRMQQRHVVAPAARPQGVERGPRPRVAHSRVPRRRCRRRRSAAATRTSAMPASRHASSSAAQRPALPEVADARPEEAPDLAPAGRDERARGRQPDADPQLPERPPDPRGRPNSSIATSPPGRTTRASSRSVAAGSST